MGVLLKNNAVSHLATSIGTGNTSLSVTAGQGGLFPAPSGSDWFPVTVVKASGVLEIMKCTARTGDVLTVVRAQESTAAQSFTAGDRVELRFTAAVMADLVAQIVALTSGALLDANNLSDLTDRAAARFNLNLTTTATTPLSGGQSDNTLGRVMKIGDRGISHPLDGRGTVFENAIPQAFYDTGETWAFVRGGADGLLIPGLPTNTFGTVHYSIQYSDLSGKAAMTRMFKTGNRLFISSVVSATVWSAWTEFLSAENLNITSFARTLLDDNSQAEAQTTLGVPPGVRKQMCSAWVSFSGVGTVTVTGAFNVSSVADLGVGQYRVNFATPMIEEYAVAASAGVVSSNARYLSHGAHNQNSIDVGNGGITNAYAPIDNDYNSVVIIGGRG